MNASRKLIPFLIGSIVVSCATKPPSERVRLHQPNVKKQVDTTFIPKKEIKWTDDDGIERIVTRAEKDSTTGENIALVELEGVTVVAQSKQVAERNGKINLDFIVTVPNSLISKKWQLQLSPIAYQYSDTIYLDKIFLSGADFAKTQKKGYLQYQAFMNSIIPDSLYLKEMFNQKGYKKAMQELEEEYFQAWKNEVLLKESWIDWSDKLNKRFILFNSKVERNKLTISGQNSFLRHLPAYWMLRELNSNTVPGKWQMFLDNDYRIKTKAITPEDSLKITNRYTNFKKIAENQRKKELSDDMYDKYVRFPYQSSRLDTIIKDGENFVYYYKQELPATENTRKILLTLDGLILAKDETKTPLPPSDTLTYFVSSMIQFLDLEPRYKKQIITRKDEVSMTAYVNYKTAATVFDEELGNNKEEIDKVFKTIHNINYTGEFLIDSIYMTATSSPEGSSSLNLALSKSRALNLKDYLIKKTDDKEGVDSLFRPRWIGEDWNKLVNCIESDDTLSSKDELLGVIRGTPGLDQREMALRKYSQDYKRITDKFYPLLRAVEFKFHLHRRDMIQDTIIMPVIDTTYARAVKMIGDRQYKKALPLLSEFYAEDYNTAICLMSLGYDQRALDIMLKQADTANRNYILAILYVRLKNETEAVKCFIKSCEQDESKIWRGKLDPEINTLLETYNLYKDEF